MKKLLAWLGRTAKDPTLRPFEIWALRAIVAFAAVKLGIDASQI